MKTYSLHFRWSISRGYNTYGYNICTLLVDGDKVASCDGGGYDMQGTVLAGWIQEAFQDRLQELFKEDIDSITDEMLELSNKSNKRKTVYYFYQYNTKKYYGVSINKLKTVINKTGEIIVNIKVNLDGACGFNSIKKIANSINIHLKWNKESDRYKNHTFYTAIDEKVEDINKINGGALCN